MTDFVPVPPINQPFWGIIGDGWMLAQAEWVLSDSNYREYVRNLSLSGTKVILDWVHPVDGEMPKHALTIDHYWAAINLIRPYEAVIPDVYQDSAATLSQAVKFLMDSRCGAYPPRWMFVPQGSTVNEFIGCCAAAGRRFGSRIHAVGVPMWIEKMSSRKAILDDLIYYGMQSYDFGTSIHMLGIWKSIDEMFFDTKVRSWDTSLPFSSAGGPSPRYLRLNPLKSQSYRKGMEYPRPVLCLDNVAYIKEILHGYTSPPQRIQDGLEEGKTANKAR